MSTQEERQRVYEWLGFKRDTIVLGSDEWNGLKQSRISQPNGKQMLARTIYTGSPHASWPAFNVGRLLRWLLVKDPYAVAAFRTVRGVDNRPSGEPGVVCTLTEVETETGTAHGEGPTPAEALGAAIGQLAKEQKK